MKKTAVVFLLILLLPIAFFAVLSAPEKPVTVQVSAAASENPDALHFVSCTEKNDPVLSVRAVDARNGTTVPNARVRIVENNAAATAVNGVCRVTPPFLPDARIRPLPPFGTCTLVVTAPDYVPTVLIGCIVTKSSRSVSVSLFLRDGTIREPVVSFSESPPTEWLASLV